MLLLLGPPATAWCGERVEVLAPGVRIDWTARFIEAAGVSAADLSAPSPEVARIRAERQARARARERLKQALTTLPRARWQGGPPAPEALEAALDRAEAHDIDYGANGSVALRLRLPLQALPAALLRR
jgi:hypothetical protein